MYPGNGRYSCCPQLVIIVIVTIAPTRAAVVTTVLLLREVGPEADGLCSLYPPIRQPTITKCFLDDRLLAESAKSNGAHPLLLWSGKGSCGTYAKCNGRSLVGRKGRQGFPDGSIRQAV